MPLQGQCNCGNITVSVKDETVEKNAPVLCRCINCRKQSGALGTYVMLAPETDVTITGSPKDYLDTKTDSGVPLHRYFCGDCGSPIMSTTERGPGLTFVKMGLFDNIRKPQMEVYCKNMQEWEVSPEGVTQIPGATGQ